MAHLRKVSRGNPIKKDINTGPWGKSGFVPSAIKLEGVFMGKYKKSQKTKEEEERDGERSERSKYLRTGEKRKQVHGKRGGVSPPFLALEGGREKRVTTKLAYQSWVLRKKGQRKKERGGSSLKGSRRRTRFGGSEKLNPRGEG